MPADLASRVAESEPPWGGSGEATAGAVGSERAITGGQRSIGVRGGAIPCRESCEMIKYDSVRTPIGVVFVAVSDRGVCDVTFGKTSQAAYRRHLSRWASEVERDHSAVAAVLEEARRFTSPGYGAGSLCRSICGTSQTSQRECCARRAGSGSVSCAATATSHAASAHRWRAGLSVEPWVVIRFP